MLDAYYHTEKTNPQKIAKISMTFQTSLRIHKQITSGHGRIFFPDA
jgi:hypothetical protein